MSRIIHGWNGGKFFPSTLCSVSNGSTMAGGSPVVPPAGTHGDAVAAARASHMQRDDRVAQPTVPTDLDKAVHGIDADIALFERLDIPPHTPPIRSLLGARDAIEYLRRTDDTTMLHVPRHPQLLTDQAACGATVLVAHMLDSYTTHIARCFSRDDTTSIHNAFFEALATLGRTSSIDGLLKLLDMTINGLARADAPHEGRGFTVQLIKTAQLIEAGRAITAVEHGIEAIKHGKGWKLKPSDNERVTISFGKIEAQRVTADAMDHATAVEIKLLPLNGTRYRNLISTLRMPLQQVAQTTLKYSNQFTQKHAEAMIDLANQIERYARLVKYNKIDAFELHIVSSYPLTDKFGEAVIELFPAGTARIFWHKDIADSAMNELAASPTTVMVHTAAAEPPGAPVAKREAAADTTTPTASVARTAPSSEEPAEGAQLIQNLPAKDVLVEAPAPPATQEVSTEEYAALLWNAVYQTDMATDLDNDQTRIGTFITWCTANVHAARIYAARDDDEQTRSMREAAAAWRHSNVAAPTPPPATPPRRFPIIVCVCITCGGAPFARGGVRSIRPPRLLTPLTNGLAYRARLPNNALRRF